MMVILKASHVIRITWRIQIGQVAVSSEGGSIMKPAPFDYFAPTSVDEVRDLLAQDGDDAKILAGGQSLVPGMALRLAQPSAVLNTNHVRELCSIRAEAHGLAIAVST